MSQTNHQREENLAEEQAETSKNGVSGERSRSISPEQRPPLPPRPSANLSLLGNRSRAPSSSAQPARPATRGRATTALSLTDVNTHVYHDGSRDLQATPAQRVVSGRESTRTSDAGDSVSVKSYVPNAELGQDVGSLFGGLMGNIANRPALLDAALGGLSEEEDTQDFSDQPRFNFAQEFEGIGELDEEGSNEEELLEKWKAKTKHFLILSAAGKPIYTRHGDTGLISGYVGIIQTIISFYQSSDDPLRTFTADGARFVIVSQNNLFLVAITRLQESEAQLRSQLDALYMQILSTLTLPNLEHIFSVRPSSDLRRPLQGTEVLLSSLADSFTRGSPSTLLSALECLKLRKSHRQAINNTFLKCRTDDLLYGLLVAGGRLVSVVRPKKHSLHPSDLQLIFNMIFEADGIKANGGESWIPICLPGFNSSGYLHMYVNFLSLEDAQSSAPQDTNTTPKNNDRNNENLSKDTSVAIILISASPHAFPALQSARTNLLTSLTSSNLLTQITTSISTGRPSSTDLIPGCPLLHFLYKSRAHVQFVMPSFSPSHYPTLESRRQLMSTYHILHASVHTKHAHVKVQHCVSKTGTALAWVTPMFELYAVGGRGTSRSALAQAANKVVQWAQKEEERLFIIGGAVF